MSERTAARRGRRGHDSDRGGPLMEFAAMFPFLLLVCVMSIEVFMTFVAAERMESAARAGARVAGEQSRLGALHTARESLPSWMQDNAWIVSGDNDSGGYYVEITYYLPVVFSSVPLDLSITRRVDMPHV
ncbi:TadE/TadG family type IV pilus assembly protein [Nocardiopsis sp. LOL_012]|uniref:TadE/TadG family type IV pilus assembly protein n=1 Tax=Nocardiopsis sp. LOL_012 TaxID=3345409 RepID=UPI003A838CA6